MQTLFMYKLQLILITFIPLYMFAQTPKFIAPKIQKFYQFMDTIVLMIIIG